MEAKVTVFNNEEFGEVRTVTIDGDPWFVGKDVAEKLGYANINKAVAMHIDEEDKKVLDFKGFSQNGNTSKLWSGNDFSNKIVVNESGLYTLIFGSKLDSAKRFKHWVTSEVLPTIRKTGGYNRPLTLEEQLQIVARGTLEVKEEIKRLDSEFEDFRNDMPLLAIEIDKITEAVKKKGVAVLGGKNSNAYKNSSLRTKLYQDLHRDVRRQFGVSTYKAIKRNQCEQVLAMVDSYKPPIFLDALISNENSQMSISL